MNLKEVKGDVQNIPDYGFRGSGNFKIVSLPKVKSFGFQAFRGTYTSPSS